MLQFCELLGRLARGDRPRPPHAGGLGARGSRPPEDRYAACERITLVRDNFNTHTKGAIHTAFEASPARDPPRRIAFCYAPKHRSWLNIAETALSAITPQCLSGRRTGKIGTLREEIAAWSVDPSTRQRGVEWRMQIDARCKLKSIYRKIKL